MSANETDIFSNILNEYIPDEPLFVVDLAKVENAYLLWKRFLPNVIPYYAVKCNPCEKIISLLTKLGCNFDCASQQEIRHVLEITKDPSRIIFAHPCKYVSHLEYAKNSGVDLMTFDNDEELHKIQKNFPGARLLLRLAVDDSHSVCKFNSKFGCELKDVERLIITAKSLNLNLVGFSFHVGSGCNSASVYYDALRICKAAEEIAEQYQYQIKIIDVGGGFVADIGRGGISIEDVSIQIQKGIDDFFQNQDIQFIAEPGRFMVQQSHTLIVSVIGKKKVNDNIVYYINDGVYGSFNCIIFDYQDPVLIPLKKHEGNVYQSRIFGNTCDSLDEIQKCVMLPELEIGDYLYVQNFGAYTTSSKSDGFNGFKVNNFRYIYNL